MGAELDKCQCCSRRTAEKDGGDAMMRTHQEVQVKEGRWAEEIPQRWRQPRGEDRTEKRKEARAYQVCIAQWIGLEHREKT